MGRLFTAERIADELLQGRKTPRWVRRHAPRCIKFKTMWGTMRRWRETEDLERWAKKIVATERKRRKNKWGKREAEARKALAWKARQLDEYGRTG